MDELSEMEDKNELNDDFNVKHYFNQRYKEEFGVDRESGEIILKPENEEVSPINISEEIKTDTKIIENKDSGN
jgi:hypothetical protein